ncbi:formate dehydrogenase accessory sulfurtransferase FdhD [Phyllobacterium phragmitis]|uniref:Sulfur carrier protein FdhD n=1 Tax=Phyllobacterium phragmitis TaxID=2670329 RepID=A0A2S9IQM4_9HYPH|nr:formate dehydrogenase accessory sulfurtransferase FdhD [Phyllobacterium phragmitis]PRD42821.1 formate dehydrogenase accessory sulfurtransferase FdhD [Phyllobacterium phragmitis]
MTERPTRPLPHVAHRKGGTASAVRIVPEEIPVAFSYGGTTHAVMMATPADMEDFAVGFSLSEGIIEKASDIKEIAVEDHDQGIDIQITLAGNKRDALTARRRHMAGPVGCGLCGIESIEQALKPVASVEPEGMRLTAGDIVQSVKLLSSMQPLHTETGAVHAAGFYIAGKGIVAAREDVGRHNALDKLAGALARQEIEVPSGAVVVTSRVSIEMVQKTAIIGAPVLIAVSAPTALAIRTAEAAGITLVALVRGDEFDIYTHTDRIEIGRTAHVA